VLSHLILSFFLSHLRREPTLKMNLRNITDNILLNKLHSLVQNEREITLQVLHHLREVERRSLFAKLAYPSLFEYAVKELKYSEGAAQRRISSMRLLKELPQLEAKVEAGALSLSTLAKAQSFFRHERENIKTPAKKIEILVKLENKSAREVEKKLVSMSSSPERLAPERLRSVTATYSELKILVEDGFLKDIEELRGLLAHSRPHASIKELIAYAVDRAVKELRPKAPGRATETPISAQTKESVVQPKTMDTPHSHAEPTQSKNTVSRHISQEVKRQVWRRDCGECGFVDPISRRKCGSKHGLEYDHIVPFAVGGETTSENLRLRCRTHNQLEAIVVFGEQKMARHVPRMR
jgi:5-methylcytosine-specific restriction endonuclease McrA